MIDVLGAVAAATPVNGAFSVEITDALLARGASSQFSFRQRDSFAYVLCDLLVLAEDNCCKTTHSVNFGSCYCESKRESLIHLGKRNLPLLLCWSVQLRPTLLTMSFSDPDLTFAVFWCIHHSPLQ
jgi:hypothetical protein